MSSEMAPTYELFDHTADIGIRAKGRDAEEMIKSAIDGLYAVIGEIVTEGEGEPLTMELVGEERAVLLRDLLSELLFVFDDEHRVMQNIKVQCFDQATLRVAGELYKLDEDKCMFEREIKAITYHELKIEEMDSGICATVIVDI